MIVVCRIAGCERRGALGAEALLKFVRKFCSNADFESRISNVQDLVTKTCLIAVAAIVLYVHGRCGSTTQFSSKLR